MHVVYANAAFESASQLGEVEGPVTPIANGKVTKNQEYMQQNDMFLDMNKNTLSHQKAAAQKLHLDMKRTAAEKRIFKSQNNVLAQEDRVNKAKAKIDTLTNSLELAKKALVTQQGKLEHARAAGRQLIDVFQNLSL
jgi:hypothetical protein